LGVDVNRKGTNMKRILLIFAIALLACSTIYRICEKSPMPETTRDNETPTLMKNTPTLKVDIDRTKEVQVSPTTGSSKEKVISASPICTLLEEEDTETVKFGNEIKIIWGWEAKTEQQVNDYIGNAITRVTFNKIEITDAEQGEIFEDGGTFHILWWKMLGVLDRGRYEMTFHEEYKKKIFDGWNYFGPGSDIVITEDKCYLVIE
jgi:hypothetical protein